MAGLCAVLTIPIDTIAEADEHTPPPPFFAKVEEITRSNSLIVVPDGGSRTQVVLAFLTIPMLNQPYGARAHDILKAQLLNRRVSVRPIGKPLDDYVLGLVYVRDNNFNLDFLQRGHAWLDVYQINHKAWRAAQAAARASGRGLYADPHAMHPLQWKTELDNAKRVHAIAAEAQQSGSFDKTINSTFVANRTDKTYVSTTCIKVWTQWPRRDWLPMTTEKGASANGYTRADCG